MQKAHLVSVMASGAAAQMNGGPAFLGAFGMGGGFEPPAMLQGMMGGDHGSHTGPTDLADDIMHRRQQRELQKQSETVVPPTSLMEVSARMPVPRHGAEQPQKRLRGAHVIRRAGSSLVQTVAGSEEAKMQKHAEMRRAHAHSTKSDATVQTGPAKDQSATAKVDGTANSSATPFTHWEGSVSQDRDEAFPMEQICHMLPLVTVDLHVGDSYKVVQHCGYMTMKDLVHHYQDVLPGEVEVRILDEDQQEVGHEVTLYTIATQTNTGLMHTHPMVPKKSDLPALLWIVENTWDPTPTEQEVWKVDTTTKAQELEHLSQQATQATATPHALSQQATQAAATLQRF